MLSYQKILTPSAVFSDFSTMGRLLLSFWCPHLSTHQAHFVQAPGILELSANMESVWFLKTELVLCPQRFPAPTLVLRFHLPVNYCSLYICCGMNMCWIRATPTRPGLAQWLSSRCPWKHTQGTSCPPWLWAQNWGSRGNGLSTAFSSLHHMGGVQASLQGSWLAPQSLARMAMTPLSVLKDLWRADPA